MQNHDTEKLVTLVLAWVGQRFLAIFVGLLSSRQFKFRQFRKKKIQEFQFSQSERYFLSQDIMQPVNESLYSPCCN